MTRIVGIVLALILSVGCASAQTGSSKSTTTLNSEVNTLWPDQTTGAITPFNARQTLLDLIASYANLLSLPATPFATGSSTGNTLTGPSGYFVCTATCTVTPPVPVAGYQFCVMNDDNVSGVITLGPLGSSAQYENTARTAYGTASTGHLQSSGAVGDMICIVGRDSTHYLSPTFVGTWTAS